VGIGLGTGLPVVGQRLVPDFSPQGMVGEAFDLVRHLVSRQRLEGLHDPRMQNPPPLLKQTPIGHLVGQGMLEGVDPLGKQTGLIEKLRRLQVRETAMQLLLGQLGDGLQ
jgi:hypothetical protein